ncbi:MAG: hypothetical protein VKK04_20475 [Synechococcales bacterium]|nr:hypothetical protein [Synechococcales bacterium]
MPKRYVSSVIPSSDYDPVFHRQLCRLHHLLVWGRWLLVIGLWISIGSASLVRLWPDLRMLSHYFTWTGLRYSLAFHPLATLGLSICVGLTVAVLLWQSRNILLGLPRREIKQLERWLGQVKRQGSSHVLWRWVCRGDEG